MNFKLALVSICIVAFSCTKNPDPQPGTFLTGSGVFILNEGNFMGGNGSVSFYSYDSSKIYNDLFASVNGRPLGDVPNSMTINGEIACIVVNNSGKIEIINKNTLESIATVSGLNSPRNISFINSKKAYVTSMYSDSVAVLNLTTSSVSGYINLRRHSESIVITGNKAFISDWIGGTEVMVVNTVTDKVTDSIKVGMEPESMVIDKNNTLWVLCNGGWMRSYFAELIGINTSTNTIDKKFTFPSKQDSPSCIQINGSGETLYYLESGSGVRQMNITSPALPSSAFIAETGHYFYKFGVNPVNGDILITDAIDYQQKGLVLHYKKDGTLGSTLTADIIPGLMCFKLNDNFKAK